MTQEATFQNFEFDLFSNQLKFYSVIFKRLEKHEIL